MAVPAKPDAALIEEAARFFMRDSAVIEVRTPNVEVVKPNGYVDKKGTVAGYFDRDHLPQLAAAVAGIVGADSIYVTLNPPDPACLARYANRLEERAKQTTADHDIERRLWVLVDCDPKRPAGVSSTDQEHRASGITANLIRQWLIREKGFPPGSIACADSGNGSHLLIAIDEPNDEPTNVLVQNFLKALAARFDGKPDGETRVTVDTSTFNAGRPCKLYGTVAGKGDSIGDRPHRLARLLFVPDELTVAGRELLEAVAAELPKPETKKPTTARAGTGSHSADSDAFDMEAWIRKIGLTTKDPKPYMDGQKWQFDCPFNPDHKAPDAALFLTLDGKPGFRCLHDSCGGRNFADLRDRLEPGWRGVESKKAKERANAGQGKDQAGEEKTATNGAEGGEAPGIRLLQVGAFLTSVGDPPPMLIDRLVPDYSLVLVSGKPKFGKSLMGLDIAECVATGTPVFGTRPVNRSGPVVVLSMEDGRYEFANRLLTRGLRAGSDLPLFVYTDRLPLGTEEGVALLREAVTPICPALAIVDTGRESLGVKDYADPAELTERLRPLRDFAREVCSVLLVSHNRKAEATDAVDEIAGSNGFTSAVDGWISARRKEDRDEDGRKVRRLHLDVDGRGGMRGSLVVEMDPDTLRFREVTGEELGGERYEEKREKDEERFAPVLAYLSEHRASSAQEVAMGMRLHEQKARRLLNEMCAAGRLRKITRPTPGSRPVTLFDILTDDTDPMDKGTMSKCQEGDFDDF